MASPVYKASSRTAGVALKNQPTNRNWQVERCVRSICECVNPRLGMQLRLWSACLLCKCPVWFLAPQILGMVAPAHKPLQLILSSVSLGSINLKASLAMRSHHLAVLLIWVCTHVHVCSSNTCGDQRTTCRNSFSLFRVGSRHLLQAIGLGTKRLYPLSQFVGPVFCDL